MRSVAFRDAPGVWTPALPAQGALYIIGPATIIGPSTLIRGVG